SSALTLNSPGQMSLSGGTSDIFGTVAVNSGAKVIVTGGATATFYNAVTAVSGSEFRVSTGSTAVFFASVNGTNFFTGSGTKDFEGGSSALDLIDTSGYTIVQKNAALTAGAIRDNSLSVDGAVTIPVNGTPTGTSKVG